MSSDEMIEPICEVIITGPDPEWLTNFTRTLVEDRLAACGHNFAPIRSIYRWNNQIHDKTEARVALQTRLSLVEEITDRTIREHPYELPCVIAVPAGASNLAYIQWILDQTRDPQA